MKNNHKFKILALFLGLLTLPVAGQATSLLEIYQQALQSDPSIHEAEARRLASLEAEPQARGLMLPQVSFGGSWITEDSSGSSSGEDSFGPFLSTSETESEITQWSFTLRQTLFRWDQIVGLRRADKVVAKA